MASAATDAEPVRCRVILTAPTLAAAIRLGRYNQGNSTDNADVAVPEERERQRTQAIQEELRRRGADQERPRQELDYIDRLLKQF